MLDPVGSANGSKHSCPFGNRCCEIVQSLFTLPTGRIPAPSVRAESLALARNRICPADRRSSDLGRTAGLGQFRSHVDLCKVCHAGHWDTHVQHVQKLGSEPDIRVMSGSNSQDHLCSPKLCSAWPARSRTGTPRSVGGAEASGLAGGHRRVLRFRTTRACELTRLLAEHIHQFCHKHPRARPISLVLWGSKPLCHSNDRRLAYSPSRAMDVEVNI